MDYESEQNNELEALFSIYPFELEVLSEDYPKKFQILLRSDDYDAEEATGLSSVLKFAYTSKYPEELPEISVEKVEHFEDGQEAELVEYLLEQANGLIGEVMVFTLVSAAQEWLSSKWDYMKVSREEARERKEREEEEAERKRFEGTRVTPEAFKIWKANFDAEFASLKKAEREKDTGKLTGREMFMKDKTLYESDLKFLEDSDVGDPKGDENIKVNEDLFQNLDGLDLSGDEELLDSD